MKKNKKDTLKEDALKEDSEITLAEVEEFQKRRKKELELLRERERIDKAINENLLVEKREKSLEEKVKTLLEENNELSSKYEELSPKYKKLSSTYDDLLSKYDDLFSKHNILLSKYRGLEKENEKLKKGKERRFTKVNRYARTALVSSIVLVGGVYFLSQIPTGNYSKAPKQEELAATGQPSKGKKPEENRGAPYQPTFQARDGGLPLMPEPLPQKASDLKENYDSGRVEQEKPAATRQKLKKKRKAAEQPAIQARDGGLGGRLDGGLPQIPEVKQDGGRVNKRDGGPLTPEPLSPETPDLWEKFGKDYNYLSIDGKLARKQGEDFLYCDGSGKVERNIPEDKVKPYGNPIWSEKITACKYVGQIFNDKEIGLTGIIAGKREKGGTTLADIIKSKTWAINIKKIGERAPRTGYQSGGGEFYELERLKELGTICYKEGKFYLGVGEEEVDVENGGFDNFRLKVNNGDRVIFLEKNEIDQKLEGRKCKK